LPGSRVTPARISPFPGLGWILLSKIISRLPPPPPVFVVAPCRLSLGFLLGILTFSRSFFPFFPLGNLFFCPSFPFVECFKVHSNTCFRPLFAASRSSDFFEHRQSFPLSGGFLITMGRSAPLPSYRSFTFFPFFFFEAFPQSFAARWPRRPLFWTELKLWVVPIFLRARLFFFFFKGPPSFLALPNVLFSFFTNLTSTLVPRLPIPG